MRKRILLILTGIFLTTNIYCIQEKISSISGKVTDNSGRPLAGATVTILNTFLGTTCSSDGTYSFIGLKDGIYQLQYSFIGYESRITEVNLNGTAISDISLNPRPLLTGEVIVNATRAGRRTPLAYAAIDESVIRKQNSGQDIPFLLGMTPSLVETSEAGNGIGYTSLRIRGTDASRINVTIDGIPLNDPESQQVFWVDLPDLASSVDNIQVQRGAGTSSNGAGAFGATVSIETKNPENEPFAQFSSSAGSFNTFKNTISAGTGLLADRFSLQVRLSQLKSDGYIRRTASDHRSAYISGVYGVGRSRLKANIILGEEHTGIGWWGVPAEMLDVDRRYNPAGEYTDDDGFIRYYDNESDNYRQDHYQLIYSLKAGEFLNLSTALHYTKGKGYYEEFREEQTYSGYGLPDIVIGDSVISATDLIRRKWLSNDFYGLIYLLNYRRGRFETNIGGGLNSYTGDHFGSVIWMKNAAAPKDYQWYFNNGTKSEGSLYAKVNYSINDKFSIYADLQQRYIMYKMSGPDDDLKDLGGKHTFSFFNPKAGLFWALSPNQDLYLSFSVAGREPTRADFKEAAGDSLATPGSEVLYDTEAGYRIRGKNHSFGINGYYMSYRNQLVPTGELSSTGYSITTNVARSYRLGIELTGAIKPAAFLHWDFNLTLSRNKIIDFTEFYIDYNTNTWEGEYKSRNLGMVDISYSPSVTGTSDIGFSILRNLEAHLISKYVGRQYFDNTMSSLRMLDPYFISIIRIGFEPVIRKVKNVDLQLSVNNIFNAKYESNAYGGNWYEDGAEKTWAYFFPQAGISFMLMATLKF